MTCRRYNSRDATPAAATIRAVNFCHSLGCSFSLSFMPSVGHRLERALDPCLGLGGSLQQEVADHQVIHLCVDKAAIGVVGGAHDRFAPHVERSIDQHPAASGLFPTLQQRVE